MITQQTILRRLSIPEQTENLLLSSSYSTAWNESWLNSPRIPAGTSDVLHSTSLQLDTHLKSNITGGKANQSWISLLTRVSEISSSALIMRKNPDKVVIGTKGWSCDIKNWLTGYLSLLP